MAATREFEDKIEGWVNEFLRSPKNLASEIELREQSNVALKYFIDADLDKSQSLSFQELRRLCDDMGLPMGNDEEEALAKIDKDGSGCLDIEEWTRWWLGRISSLPNPAKQQEAIATNTFRRIDIDGSGFLDSSEFATLLESLGAQFSPEEISQALNEVDNDQSGVIECSEFVAWWTNRTSSNRSSMSLIGLKLRKLAAKASQIFYKDIFSAVWEGNADLVKAFIDSENRLVHASDESEYGGGWKPLHYACYQGLEKIVEMLLDGGAAVNGTNDRGFTPLFYAAQRGHIEICTMLIERGADPSLYGTHAEDDDIFLCAADFVSEYKALRSLLKTHAKAQPPGKLSAEDLAATLSTSTGQLTISIKLDTKALGKLSTLPITKWKICLSFDGDGAQTCEFLVRAINPKKEQTISTSVTDKKWLGLLNFQYTNILFEEIGLQESTTQGLVAVWRRIRSLYKSMDSRFQRRIRLDEKFMAALERGPSSEEGAAIVLRKNVKLKMITASAGQSAAVPEDADAAQFPPTGGVPLTLEQIEEIVTSMTNSSNASQATNKSLAKDATTASASSKKVVATTSTKTIASTRPKSASAVASSSKPGKSDSPAGSDDPNLAKVVVWIKVAALNGMFEGEFGEEIPVEVSFPSLGNHSKD